MRGGGTRELREVGGRGEGELDLREGDEVAGIKGSIVDGGCEVMGGGGVRWEEGIDGICVGFG